MEHFQRSLTTGNGSFPTANDIKERSLSTRSLVFSVTSMGLVGSVASKYMIDIITGYQMSKLWIMVLITLGSAFFS